MNREELEKCLTHWCRKLRVTPTWNVRLQLMDDPNYRKTGDIKIDCDNHNAIVMLNMSGANCGNLEEVLVHELFHLKLYPMDQVTESLIRACFPEESSAKNFAYEQFFHALEQTAEELTKCFLLEYGDNKELTFGRCEKQKSFIELYDGLRNLK